MFEKYMIVDTEAHNLASDGGQPTGFAFGVRLPYYRGVRLSLVEDLEVRVDGQTVPREALRLTVHGNTYTLAELEAETEDRWEMGEVAMLSFAWPGGLPSGPHQLQLTINLRVAYMPFPAIRSAEKTVLVA